MSLKVKRGHEQNNTSSKTDVTGVLVCTWNIRYGSFVFFPGVCLEYVYKGISIECAPNKTLWYENTTDWYFWCDYECNNMGPISLNPTPAACNFLNRSLARKEKCTKLK